MDTAWDELDDKDRKTFISTIIPSANNVDLLMLLAGIEYDRAAKKLDDDLMMTPYL